MLRSLAKASHGIAFRRLVYLHFTFFEVKKKDAKAGKLVAVRARGPDGKIRPGARFSKAPESFRARKANFRSSVSKHGEVYTPETSCMKGTEILQWLYGPEKFPGLSRNGPQGRKRSDR